LSGIRLYAKQVAHGIPFLGRILGLKASRVERLFPFVGRHLAQIAECLAERALAVRGQLPKQLAGAANRGLLLRRQCHESLVALHDALPRGRGLHVQAVQPIDELLLLSGRKMGKTRFASQRLLLLLRTLAAVLSKPLRQMLATTPAKAGGAGAEAIPTRTTSEWAA
jgi:hypothetical protein